MRDISTEGAISNGALQLCLFNLYPFKSLSESIWDWCSTFEETVKDVWSNVSPEINITLSACIRLFNTRGHVTLCSKTFSYTFSSHILCIFLCNLRSVSVTYL